MVGTPAMMPVASPYIEPAPPYVAPPLVQSVDHPPPYSKEFVTQLRLDCLSLSLQSFLFEHAFDQAVADRAAQFYQYATQGQS